MFCPVMFLNPFCSDLVVFSSFLLMFWFSGQIWLCLNRFTHSLGVFEYGSCWALIGFWSVLLCDPIFLENEELILNSK